MVLIFIYFICSNQLGKYQVKDMEENWPHFKEEPRNLRIYLEADGVNPFS